MFGRRRAPRVWCLGRRALGVSQGGRGAGAADRSCKSRVHRSQSTLHGGLDDGRPGWHGLERGRADRRGGRLARLCTAWGGWGVPSRPVSSEDRGAVVCWYATRSARERESCRDACIAHPEGIGSGSAQPGAGTGVRGSRRESAACGPAGRAALAGAPSFALLLSELQSRTRQ